MIMTNNNSLELLEKYFDTAIASPDGIKRLRELILSLAMQGKLVPQDPNDPPASELLKEIEAEKERLIKEEGLKTSAQKYINKDEIYIEIPARWEYCRLGNLAKFIDYRGKTPIKVDSGIPLITAKNIRFGFINREPYEYITEEEYKAWMTRGFPKIGDVLFTTEAPLGNIAIIDIQERFALAQRVICLQLHKPNIAIFLKLLMMSNIFQDQLLNNATGMTAKGIKASRLKEIPIPLPPLAEQYRIVKKVDFLMAQCDELEKLRAERDKKRLIVHSAARDRLLNTKDDQSSKEAWDFIRNNFSDLYSVKENVKELRKAILQLAVMGKLVPQDQNDQPASELLKEIEAEKVQLGIIQKSKKIIKQAEIPYKLPDKWEWIQTEIICEIIVDCPHSTAKFVTDGIICIDTNSFKEGNLLEHKLRYVSEETYIERVKRLIPKKDDVIFAREGSVGESVIIPEGMKCCLGQRVMLFRPMKGILTRYLQLSLSNPSFLLRLLSLHKGIGAKHVNVGDMRNALISLPPLIEQKRIMTKIDQLMAFCDRLEQQIDQSTNKQTDLLNAVIAKI